MFQLHAGPYAWASTVVENVWDKQGCEVGQFSSCAQSLPAWAAGCRQKGVSQGTVWLRDATVGAYAWAGAASNDCMVERLCGGKNVPNEPYLAQGAAYICGARGPQPLDLPTPRVAAGQYGTVYVRASTDSDGG